MLTGKQLRIRVARDRVIPLYSDPNDSDWLDAAERLRQLFRACQGQTRGALTEEIKESFGGDPRQVVHQGLAKLLEDRCEFEVVSGQPPEQIREMVFAAAAKSICLSDDDSGASQGQLGSFLLDRHKIMSEAAATLSVTPEAVEQGLLADLQNEQRLIRFKDISAARLLARYNVALAQAVLLRSTRVDITIAGERAPRLRQIFRGIKFRRLIAELECGRQGELIIHLDGPLSLFSATQKYGLQLALFLPALLTCRSFSLRAELLWGPQRKQKFFTLTSEDGLVADGSRTDAEFPQELSLFAELFQKKITDWELVDENTALPLGNGAGSSFWTPDFRLVHRESGQFVYLEVLGYWRRANVERHLERLRQHVREPFVLAVSEQLDMDEADLEGLPAGIHRFRRMPLPEEIVRLAEGQLKEGGKGTTDG